MAVMFIAKVRVRLRANEAHLAPEDVQQLWKLVDGRTPKKTTDGRKLRSGHPSQRCRGCAMPIEVRGAEFHEVNRPAIETKAALSVEDRAARGEPNRTGDGQKDGKQTSC